MAEPTIVDVSGATGSIDALFDAAGQSPSAGAVAGVVRQATALVTTISALPTTDAVGDDGWRAWVGPEGTTIIGLRGSLVGEGLPGALTALSIIADGVSWSVVETEPGARRVVVSGADGDLTDVTVRSGVPEENLGVEAVVRVADEVVESLNRELGEAYEQVIEDGEAAARRGADRELSSTAYSETDRSPGVGGDLGGAVGGAAGVGGDLGGAVGGAPRVGDDLGRVVGERGEVGGAIGAAVGRGRPATGLAAPLIGAAVHRFRSTRAPRRDRSERRDRATSDALDLLDQHADHPDLEPLGDTEELRPDQPGARVDEALDQLDGAVHHPELQPLGEVDELSGDDPDDLT